MAEVTVTTEQVHELIQQLAAMNVAASITPQIVANIFEKMRNLNDQEREKVIATAEAYIQQIQDTGIAADHVTLNSGITVENALKALNLKIDGNVEHHSFSEFVSNDYYSFENGSLVGSEGSYRTAEFNLRPNAKISANFAETNNSFGLLFYNGDTFLSGVHGTSIIMDAPNGATKVIIQTFYAWSETSLTIENWSIDEKLENLSNSINANAENIEEQGEELDSLKGFLVEYNYFEKTVDGYIGANGVYSSTELGVVTDYVKVSANEEYHYQGGWQSNNAIGMIWGYDANKGNAVKLVPSASNVSTIIEIPEGIEYIRAWSATGKEGVLTRKTLTEEVSEVRAGLDTIFSYESNEDIAQMTVTNNAQNKWLVINNGSVLDSDCRIIEVSFKAVSANSEFFVCTFAKEDNVVILKSKTEVSASNAGLNSVPVDIIAKKGYYVGVLAKNGADFIKYGASITNGWFWNSNKTSANVDDRITIQTLSNYTIAFGYKIQKSIFEFATDSVPEERTTTIVATRNADDFNSIRDIVNGITDASPYNKYIIYVPKGRWHECDLNGKEYVKIVGADREETVIYNDGTSILETPSDYSRSAYANMPLSSIDRNQKHIIFAMMPIDIANVTLEANDCKYCAHLDYNDFGSVNFENCHFIAKTNINYAIGIGIRGGQTINVINSIIEREENNKDGIFVHNWNNQTKACGVVFDRCLFRNCGFGIIDELGSEQDDQFFITYCYSETTGEITWMVDYNSNGDTYWKNNGVNESNPQLVPYCIKLNTMGTNVKKIILSVFGGTNKIVARPNAREYMITDFGQVID